MVDAVAVRCGTTSAPIDAGALGTGIVSRCPMVDRRRAERRRDEQSRCVGAERTIGGPASTSGSVALDNPMGERVAGSDVPVGSVVEATIERIVPGGLGLAHAGGRTLFVALAAPGDRLRVRVDRLRSGVGFATIVEIVEPSAARIEPPHPAFTHCGGCDFQHLAYEAQLAAKVEIVRDSLRRIAGVESPENLPISASPQRWGYRTRAEWRHDAERRLLGYVEQGSHRVCDVAHDPIVVPQLDAARGELCRRLAAGKLPGDAAEFRVAAGDEDVTCSPPLSGSEPTEIIRTVGEERYAHDADSFFQANPGVLEPLVAEALRFVAAHEGTGGTGPAIDLYCGVGLFTLPLARRFEHVIGVEAHRRSATYASRNATNAGLRTVRIEAMPVDRWLNERWRSFGRAPFVLLDPPRTGIDRGTLHGLLRLRPARLAYVSCDPGTQARDLRALLAGGYRLEGVALFDMFPQTHHVETVAHLARSESDEAVRPRGRSRSRRRPAGAGR